MRALFFLAVLLFSCYSAEAVIFNEIMYDPIGSDTDKEWIEIYNDGNETINISGWKFLEGGVGHSLIVLSNSTLLFPNNFAVIVQDNETFLNSSPDFSGILIDSTFSLSNSGETLVLKNKTGQVQDNVTYNSALGASENGMTLGLYGERWNETIATPGRENVIPEICDWQVSINSSLIFENDFNFKIRVTRINGNPANVTIFRQIEDTSGNIVKEYENITSKITNYNTLSYTPNLAPGTYLIKANIMPWCNDSVLDNNFAEKLVAVKGETQQTVQENTTAAPELETDSSILISNVYDLGKDESAEFGQTIRVKLIVYRGDTAKRTVSLRIEDEEKVSKVLSLNIPEKYLAQEFTLPIAIFPDCGRKFGDGNYRIIAEGLGEEDSEEIEIKGNANGMCEKEIIVKEKIVEKIISSAISQTQSQKTQEFNTAKPFALSTVVFESSQRKAEKIMPVGMIAISFIAVLFILKAKNL